MKLNTALTQARKQHSWSQEEVATMIGTTQANLSRWERGITSPMPHYTRKLCELYQKNLEELFPRVFNSHWDEDRPVFLCNAALTDPNDFVGREREIRTLLTRARTGQSTSIIGPRRIGKTWLLNYLCLTAEEKLGDKYTIGYLDATSPKCSGIVGFTTEILHALDIPPEERGWKNNLITLENAAAQKKKNGEFFILCIDEFEGVCKQPDFSLEVLENLRAIAQQYQLSLVTASKKRLLDVVAGIAGSETSPFFNIFFQLRLGPFSRHDAEKFVKDKGQQAQFIEQEKLLLLECSQDQGREQWHPWLLQFVGELIYQDKRLATDSYRPDEPTYREELLQCIEDGAKGVIET